MVQLPLIYTILLQEIINEATEGRGADGILEAVGNSAASRLAYELIRLGGVISTVGVHTSEQFAFSPIEAYDKNITYKIGRAPARKYMQQLLQQPTKYYDSTKIITHRLPLKEGKKAYDLFDKKQNGCIKVVLQP